VGRSEKDLEKHRVVSQDLSIIVLDHVIPRPTRRRRPAQEGARVRREVRDPTLLRRGRRRCHQSSSRRGFALPGRILVGSDSHTCAYGAVNAFATGIDRTEPSALLLAGETWLRVPPTIRITLKEAEVPGGPRRTSCQDHRDLRRTRGTTTRWSTTATWRALSGRPVVSFREHGIEMGAKIAVFPFDAVTGSTWLPAGVARTAYEPVWSDADADYKAEPTYNLDAIEPMIALPHKVDNVKRVADAKGIEIQQALLGTCIERAALGPQGGRRILEERGCTGA